MQTWVVRGGFEVAGYEYDHQKNWKYIDGAEAVDYCVSLPRNLAKFGLPASLRSFSTKTPQNATILCTGR